MKKNTFEFDVDLKVYPVQAIYAASYTFIEKAYVKIVAVNDDKVTVCLTSKDSESKILESEFYNELLHHSLRLAISERNKDIRERIVVKALSSAVSNLNPSEKVKISKKESIAQANLDKQIKQLLKQAEKGTYKQDPYNIAEPWEEKKGNSK